MDNNETDKNMKVDFSTRDTFDAGRAAVRLGYESLPEFVRAAVKQATQSALAKAKAEKAPAGV